MSSSQLCFVYLVFFLISFFFFHLLGMRCVERNILGLSNGNIKSLPTCLALFILHVEEFALCQERHRNGYNHCSYKEDIDIVNDCDRL